MNLDLDYDPLTDQLVTAPQNGSVTLRPDGSFTYEPDPGFAGQDSFTYQASDGIDTSLVAMVVLDVGRVDLDIDSDNNGYINTSANKTRMQAEDQMEAATAKPITFFGNNSPHPENSKYIPLRVRVKGGDDLFWSIHYTPNIAVYEETNNGMSLVPSNYKFPFSSHPPRNEYKVKAIDNGDSGFPSGLDKIHFVLWDANWQELERDTVTLKVQDGSSVADWVIPNDWTIDDTGFKTPMPVEGAVGPRAEGTGVDYNEYNSGDAYTRAPVQGAFSLSFTVELDPRYVHADYRPKGGDERITADDERKLSFVANSGVKIGPINQRYYEVAILDVVGWVNMIGGLAVLNDPNAWVGDKVHLVDEEGNMRYVEEPLSQLMTAVKYKGNYDDMTDAQGINATGWEDYYKILERHYNRFQALGRTYRMKVEYDGNATLTVSVAPQGSNAFSTVYQDKNFQLQGTNNYLHLQSHWGSGVRFTNMLYNP